MSLALAEVGISVLDCEHKTPAAQPSGFPYIAIPDIQDGRVLVNQARLISENDLTEWTRRTTPGEGDILVTRRGRVGDTAPIPEGLRCAIGQNLVLLRSDGTMVDQAFLRWAVRSPQWWSEVDRLMNVGAVFSSLNVRDIARIRLDFPPLPEQQAIAEVLGALDDKIAANTALASTAWASMETEFRALQVVPDRERRTLGAIASLEYGKALPASVRERGDVSVVGSGGISGVHSAALVDQSGVVVGRKGSAGAVHWVSGPHFPIDTTFYVRGKLEEVSQPYLYFLLRTLRLNEMNNDSAVPGLNRSEALALPVVLPSADHLNGFTDRAGVLIELVEGIDRENRTLASTRDALLPQLMSGKLRVRDGEAVASEAGA